MYTVIVFSVGDVALDERCWMRTYIAVSSDEVLRATWITASCAQREVITRDSADWQIQRCRELGYSVMEGDSIT